MTQALWRAGATPEETREVEAIDAQTRVLRLASVKLARERQLIINRACQRVRAGMTKEREADLQMRPGDRVYRWISAGSDRNFDCADLQPLTVVRVNRDTVTVRTDEGSTIRLPPQDIRGRYVDEREDHGHG